MMSIEEKRRELFEAWCIENHGTMGMPSYPEWCLEKNLNGKYSSLVIQGAWGGFNAALDAVAITLPPEDERGRITRTSAMRAIESAGLKVNP